MPAGEHHATLDTVEWLATHEGAVVDELPLDEVGRLRLDALEAALARDAASVALVTMLWANNEVGTIQPVEQVARLTARAGVPLHVDAISAYGQLPIDFHGLRRATDAPRGAGLVALSVSAHKIGGPAGIGALVLDRTAAVEPLIHGGGQQRRVRSGTQDVAAAASFAAAAPAVHERARRRRPADGRTARPAHRGRARRGARGAALGRPRSGRAAARQRALLVPRLRGRLAALPARRGRRRRVDRLGLPGGRARAVARAHGHGPLRGRRPRRAAHHDRPRVDRRRRRRVPRRAARRVRPGRAGRASPRARRRSTADDPLADRRAAGTGHPLRSALPTLDG